MQTRRLDSTGNRVSKYVFDFAEGGRSAVAEAVLYQYPTFEERTVICCSTQSGCPIGCRFCGAGDYFVRSLAAEEIVAQSKHIFRDKFIDPRLVKKLQIMFMSMGEPMLNARELFGAIVCERDEHVSAANERQRSLVHDFINQLVRRGYSTRMFDPAGQDDIGGGCGQLWFVQEWMRKHPELARPSVGNHLPVRHTPR